MTTATATQGTKVSNIEHTVSKNNVRNNISRQSEQLIFALEKNQKCPPVINIASLAAENWFFEYLLMNNLKHSLLLQKEHDLKFISAEKDKQTAIKSFINMPDNATVLKGMFNDIFANPFKTAKAGFSYLTEPQESYRSLTQYQMIWADYCSYANTVLLQDFANVLEWNIEKGLIYLTFCLSKAHGAERSSLKDLKKYSKSKDIVNVTLDAVEHFAKSVKGKKIKEVFRVIYGGGGRSGTTMLTIGYSVNMAKGDITPLTFDDGEWKSELRNKRQMVAHSRLKKVKGWTIKKVGRKALATKTKVRKSSDQLRLDGAVTRWEAKWKDQTPEKKIAIAKKYDVKMKQFACMVACRHGKLAKRNSK